METKNTVEDKNTKSTERLKKLMRMGGWIAAVFVFIILFGAMIADSKIRECNNVYIKIDHENGLFFLDEEDINTSIFSFYNQDLVGTLMSNVDFVDIEEKLEENPFVQSAEIYSSTKGSVYVDVQQRAPLLRIVNNSGVSYYLDMNGLKMPLSSKFTARVVVATGYVEDSNHSGVLGDLLTLCRFISADKFWKAQFEQIYVTESGEFELIPKLGSHIIRLGKLDGMEGKFEKLMIFYKEVLKNFDAEEYRVVNLKFKDQIVCTKK